MYLRGRGKIGYIIGDKKQPDKADADYDTWDVENSMVMTWLVNSMDEEICANYLCKDTAKELWEGVSQMYYDLENQSQIYELTLKLGEIRQDEGLNANFDEVRGRIIGRNPIPPIGEVFSEVRREESRRQVMLDKNTSVVPPPIEGSALAIPHVGKFGDRLMPMANDAYSSPCTNEQMYNLLKFLKFDSSLNIPIGTVA
ncbi:hypothetical protein KIW84_015834 [Lathyrus oleraceus]|uniref:Uncharacterized protein n=1 Tax=Pisum sativum TaxID=3888 RepID=A0A9D5H188_PEA|nr:hypothetical protein KIW84_015834 [Pisum sativum]